MKTYSKKYCESLTEYKRLLTREINIGDIPLGGDNPIRIQSMTTTDTMDTVGTAEQTIRMVESGCEYVRITAPSIKEAENLRNIKNELKRRGCYVPLIADIHYTPNAAEAAARIVEKVRINPGNYVDKKKFAQIEYTDSEYQSEIERIRERLKPLILICKEYGTAMRIGTNHGSLSDRIMSRYGDTAFGMVESALEFARIAEDFNYYNLVFSMKSSNPQVMVQAYRLLVARMKYEEMNYPLHIGVTEAGDGEDGRIKSAAGIGTLLEDGIGDTVRVSLTEPPEFEAPVARTIVSRYNMRDRHRHINHIEENPIDPYSYTRRESFEFSGIGGNTVPKVIADYTNVNPDFPEKLIPIGYTYLAETDKWKITDQAADYIYLGRRLPDFELPLSLKAIYDYSFWLALDDKSSSIPLFSKEEYLSDSKKSFLANILKIDASEQDILQNLETENGNSRTIILLTTDNLHGMAEQRRFLFEMVRRNIKLPVIISRKYESVSSDQLLVYSAADYAALLIDGFGDAFITALPAGSESSNGINFLNRTLFGILQASRVRISKTEYIACPSCGRTLFDLVEVTQKIRKRTEHLKGVKIGIMGCIVNGPGEMADADYGYVGSGPGKITLYRGQTVVKKSVNSEDAVDELINLIKEDGKWVDLQKE